MRSSLLSAKRWKEIRPDIMWCSKPSCGDECTLVAWPNMQISRAVWQQCKDAFDRCIIEREHPTRFHGCMLNQQTQEVDAIFEVHRDDASKTFFMSSKAMESKQYDDSDDWLHRRAYGGALAYNL